VAVSNKYEQSTASSDDDNKFN